MHWARHQFSESVEMNDIAAQKQAMRKAAMVVRKAAHEAGGGQQAAPHLIEWLKTAPPVRHISGYMPIYSEIDILPAMRQLFKLGYKISVPVIVAKATPLRFREWTPESVLVDGPFGAKVPDSGAWHRPDLLLCPMLAFDSTGQRMGYGGGFYDRSIAELKSEKPVQALGYAYSAQQVEAVPHEATDQPLDGVVTEAGVMLSGQ